MADEDIECLREDLRYLRENADIVTKYNNTHKQTATDQFDEVRNFYFSSRRVGKVIGIYSSGCTQCCDKHTSLAVVCTKRIRVCTAFDMWFTLNRDQLMAYVKERNNAPSILK